MAKFKVKPRTTYFLTISYSKSRLSVGEWHQSLVTPSTVSGFWQLITRGYHDLLFQGFVLKYVRHIYLF